MAYACMKRCSKHFRTITYLKVYKEITAADLWCCFRPLDATLWWRWQHCKQTQKRHLTSHILVQSHKQII